MDWITRRCRVSVPGGRVASRKRGLPGRACALIGVIGAIALLMGASFQAPAAVHRCVDQSGAVTYTDRRCPSASQRPASIEEDDAEVAGAGVAQDVPAAPAEWESPAKSELPRAAPSADAPAFPSPNTTTTATRVQPAVVHGRVFLVGAVLWIVAWIWMSVIGFRGGSTVWGLLLLLGAPITNLVYPFFHWKRTRAAFALFMLSSTLCLVFFVSPWEYMDVVASRTTARESWNVAEPSRRSFAEAETVYALTAIEWEKTIWPDRHTATWIWYSDNQVRARFDVPVEFKGYPFILRGYLPAARLGPGPAAVEVYVDRILMDLVEFTIDEY